MTSDDQNLLRTVIARRQPPLLDVTDALGRSPLTDELREEFRLVLADELCEVGLLPSGEPNELGVRLDDLIGRLRYF